MDNRQPHDTADEILLELTPIGNLVRVAAFHPGTLTEVTFQAPSMTDRVTLLALARRKLAFVTNLERPEERRSAGTTSGRPRTRSRR